MGMKEKRAVATKATVMTYFLLFNVSHASFLLVGIWCLVSATGTLPYSLPLSFRLSLSPRRHLSLPSAL